MMRNHWSRCVEKVPRYWISAGFARLRAFLVRVLAVLMARRVEIKAPTYGIIARVASMSTDYEAKWEISGKGSFLSLTFRCIVWYKYSESDRWNLALGSEFPVPRDQRLDRVFEGRR
jgi:hypothetical protein